jgi:hypothetical protein
MNDKVRREIENNILSAIETYKAAIREKRPDLQDVEVQIVIQTADAMLKLFTEHS